MGFLCIVSSINWTSADYHLEEEIHLIELTPTISLVPAAGKASPVEERPRMGPCDSLEWPEGPNKEMDAGPEFHSYSSKQLSLRRKFHHGGK